MPVTEYERNQLVVWFEAHMGKDLAASMMSMLPHAGWGDVATKRDLDVLEERLDAKIDVLDAKIDVVADRLDAKIDAKIDVLDAKIGAVADRLDAKIHAVTAEMATKDDLHALQRTFVAWILTAQATVVTAVGLLLVALR